MSDKCKAAMLEAGAPYPCAADCPCALEIENKALRAENARLREALETIKAKAYSRPLHRMRPMVLATVDAALETKKAPGDTENICAPKSVYDAIQERVDKQTKKAPGD